MSQLSIVIPVYNERESLAPLHKEIQGILDPLGISYEILYIDDGSTDGSRQVLNGLPGARVLTFTRNFGKSQALQAGFDAAEGEYIITMDGDLQDDPHEIPHFINTIETQPLDLVCGWKQKRADPVTKKIASKIANTVTQFITGVAVHDMNCCFKLYRREVAKQLVLYGDMHRFIPAVVAAMGYRVGEIPVHHRARLYGVSKYGIGRLVTSLFDFFTLVFVRKFLDRPMHFFGSVGLVSGTLGFFVLVYLTYQKVFEGALIGNRPLLLFGVLAMVVGVQLFSFGLMGELVIRQRARSERSYMLRTP